MKYKNTKNGFVVDSKVALGGVWKPLSMADAKADAKAAKTAKATKDTKDADAKADAKAGEGEQQEG